MASTGSEHDRDRAADAREGAARTIAQTFCLVVGVGLVAAGILGFIFGGSDFTTGSSLQGEEFIGLEVNGWHNVVHIATGALLLAVAPNAKAAATGAAGFGLAYLVVTVWGFVDGNDVLNLIPVNTADNWLHVALTASALLAAAMAGAFGASARRKREGRPATG